MVSVFDSISTALGGSGIILWKGEAQGGGWYRKSEYLNCIKYVTQWSVWVNVEYCETTNKKLNLLQEFLFWR